MNIVDFRNMHPWEQSEWLAEVISDEVGDDMIVVDIVDTGKDTAFIYIPREEHGQWKETDLMDNYAKHLKAAGFYAESFFDEKDGLEYLEVFPHRGLPEEIFESRKSNKNKKLVKENLYVFIKESNTSSPEKEFNKVKDFHKQIISEVKRMKQEYEKVIEEYNNFKSTLVKEEIDKIVSELKDIFPDYTIKPIKLGISISSNKGILGETKYGEKEAKDAESGLGDFRSGEKIIETVLNKYGDILKKGSEEIAWYSDDYADDGTDWVFTEIEFVVKQGYFKNKYNLKSAPSFPFFP